MMPLYPGDSLALPQAARLLSSDVKTLELWILQKKLKAEQSPVTRHYQVRAVDLYDFLKKESLPIPAELNLLQKKRILVVDDETNMISSIRRIFLDGPDAPYVIETAGNGFEAGQIIERFCPGLVIMDVWMPKMDGFKLCSWIKQNPKTKHIKILAISGLVKKEDQRLTVDFAADAFLEKPFSNTELKNTAENLLLA